jgi:hypothetical protein
MQHYELKVILGMLLLVVFTIGKGDQKVDLDGYGELFNFNEILSRQMKNFTTTQRKFQREMLNAHNNYRSRHCARPFRLDDNLSRSAQNYAQRLANINTMVHSGTKGLGENLYMMTSSSKITTITGKFLYDQFNYI